MYGGGGNGVCVRRGCGFAFSWVDGGEFWGWRGWRRHKVLRREIAGDGKGSAGIRAGTEAHLYWLWCLCWLGKHALLGGGIASDWIAVAGIWAAEGHLCWLWRLD